MKLTNSTDWPDYFLRRMTAWCAKQINLPMRAVKRGHFGKRSRGSKNGRAWYSMRFRVMIGPASEFPIAAYVYPGRTHERYTLPALADREEALVEVTAHELTHLRCYLRWRTSGRIRKFDAGGELHSTHEGRRVLELFKANRAALLAEWSAARAEKPAKPAASLQEKRAAKAAADLERWQRKLKLAQTKVRKCKRKVAYYDKAIAANRGAE